MSKELRNIFEKELKTYFKEKFSKNSNIKVLKNELSIKHVNGTGRVGIRFLNNAQGYNLSESAVVLDLKAFLNTNKPPYKPNFPTDYELVMNTSMENTKNRQFASGGIVRLPKNDKDREKAIHFLYSKIYEIYLPRVMNLLEGNVKVIDDVFLFPNYYKYPFLTALFIAHINNLKTSDIDMDRLLSKKITGNKMFDKQVLNKYL